MSHIRLSMLTNFSFAQKGDALRAVLLGVEHLIALAQELP